MRREVEGRRHLEGEDRFVWKDVGAIVGGALFWRLEEMAKAAYSGIKRRYCTFGSLAIFSGRLDCHHNKEQWNYG
jgi:hypothetical protein